MRIHLVEPDPAWPHRFAAFGSDLRHSLTDQSVPGVAERLVAIHHIGSTSVAGLTAKPVIDIQVTVSSFEPFEPLREAIEVHGYRWSADNIDRRKRFFQLDNVDGERMVNLHVRVEGEFSQRAALLFRDYLRDEPFAVERYAATKLALAEQDWPDVDTYADAKGDIVWQILREADVWAQARAWSPGPSDA
ncbi:hypothetical protein BH10ACT3_BH10ACT3_12640 [soil metagenome]